MSGHRCSGTIPSFDPTSIWALDVSLLPDTYPPVTELVIMPLHLGVLRLFATRQLQTRFPFNDGLRLAAISAVRNKATSRLRAF
jgi:hypothetical protein